MKNVTFDWQIDDLNRRWEMIHIPSINASIISFLFTTNQIEFEEYKKFMLDPTGTYYPKLKNNE